MNLCEVVLKCSVGRPDAMEMQDCPKATCSRELKVMRSNAGFYIGSSDTDGGPYCRATGYMDKETAEEKLRLSKEWAKSH